MDSSLSRFAPSPALLGHSYAAPPLLEQLLESPELTEREVQLRRRMLFEVFSEVTERATQMGGFV